MTDAELKTYYADLLILQYRGMTKAHATIEAFVDPLIMNQLPLAVQDAFGLETAVGVQLDVIGKYQGVTRYGYDFSGAVTLTDDDFRQLIKIAIVQNASNGSLASIQSLLALFFPGTIYIFDYKDMRISYFIDSDATSESLAQFFIKQGRLPKPMGVGLGLVLYLTSIDDVFGCRDDEIPGYPWSAITTYDTGDVVEDGTTNNLYISLIDSNLNNLVSDAAAWRLLLFPVGGFSIDTNGLGGRILTDGDFV